MLKKVLIGVIAASYIATSFATNAADANQNNKIKFIHNDVEQQPVAQPVMKNGSVFVPVRIIFDAIKVDYAYDSKTKTVSAKQDDHSIQLTIGQKNAQVNGKTVILKDAVFTLNGYTYVPLRLIGEAFGADISWDGNTKSVNIKTAPSIPPSPTPLKDEAGFNELKQLTDSYPSNILDHLEYIILEKKDPSWLHFYLNSVKKVDRQYALELSLLAGNVAAADYILTYYKQDISNTAKNEKGGSLFINTYVGLYWNYHVRLIPNKDAEVYKPTNTVETSLQLIELLASHGFKPSDIDLLRTLQGHTDQQIPTLQKLIELGADINKPLPEYVSLDENEQHIKFGLLGESNNPGVEKPLIVQSYYMTTWNPDVQNIRKFNAIVQLGGNLNLLTDKQIDRIVYLVKDKPEFEQLYKQITQ